MGQRRNADIEDGLILLCHTFQKKIIMCILVYSAVLNVYLVFYLQFTVNSFFFEVQPVLHLVWP